MSLRCMCRHVRAHRQLCGRLRADEHRDTRGPGEGAPGF
jgi:hypothetical protein